MGRWVAAGLMAALLVLPAGGFADQKDPRLDRLFERLRTTTNPTESQAIEGRIWDIWSEIADRETSSLMARGNNALGRQELRTALTAFDAVIKRSPDFAEGWNKRATVNFLMGRIDDSVRDVQKTLELEPRHFGALSGLGLIYMGLDKDSSAIQAFEAALKLHPHLAAVKENRDSLVRRKRGRDI